MSPQPLGCCVFAVRLADEAQRAAVEARVAALTRFYAPLGEPVSASTYEPSIRVLAGTIRFDGTHAGADGPFVFGARLPAALGSRLIDATDAELRELEGPLAAIALSEGRGRVVGGTGPAALYEARAGGLEAWSSHCVAAAFLATGTARVATSALPALVAVEFAGARATLVEGARAVPAATCVDIDRAGARTRSYWPAAERWAPLPERDAYAAAATALVESAGRRLGGEGGVVCALTGGLDSRVVALALREAGLPFEALTWGDPDWPDATGAAGVAAELGVPHRVVGAEWFEEERAVAEAVAETRWTEGGRVDFGRPVFPPRLTALVTGAGGETGRCFYYRPATALYGRPSARTLVRLLVEGPGSRLAGADPEAARAFERAALGWVEEAEQLGARGWRALDVVYSEQRVRRWGRHMLMRPGAPIVAPLAAPPVQRALAWLPLAERVSSGFHRRFLAERLPALAVAEPPPLSRRRVPPALRRAVRAARGLRSAPSVSEPSMWEWGRHRVLHGWIADEVLTSPLLAEGLGGTWTAGLRERFLAGERDAEELARWAAGPVALAHALRELAEPVAGGSSAAGANRQDCTL